MFAQRMNNIQKSFIREILKVIKQDDVISFAGGLPNPNFFPVEGIKKATEKVLSENAAEALQYSTTEGHKELREFIAKRYERKAVNVSFENILILNGSQQGLDLIGKIFIDKGDKILMEKPGYLGAIQAFSMYEPEIHMVTLENDGVNLAELEEKLKNNKYKFFYGVPNFQNPTGVSYSEEKRKALAELLRKYQVIYVEDDPYGEIRFLGEDKKSIHYYYPEGTMLLGSFSKIVAPGLRLGWVVANEEIFEKLVIAKQGADLHSNYFSQKIIYEFLKDEDLDKHIQKIKDEYANQRKTMVKCAEEIFPKEFKITLPEGGMFLWVDVPESIDVMDFFDYAIKEKVAFVPGNPFFVEGEKVTGFRLNFSNSTSEEVVEGMNRLKRAMEKMLKK